MKKKIEPPYKFSAHKKNIDNMRLLVSDPDFQKEIAEIRKNPILTSTGISTTASYDEIQEFRNAVTKICKSFGVPKNYDRYIEEYIHEEEIHAPLNNFDVCPSPDALDPREARYITINVYAKLTNPELEDLKKEVELLGNKLISFQPIKDIGKKIRSEQVIATKNAHNATADKGDRLTVKEMKNKKTAKRISEDHRELEKHRVKRFGKKRAKVSE